MLDGILTQVHHQWANRPEDERFTNLHDLYEKVSGQRYGSTAKVVSNRRILAEPAGDNAGLYVTTETGTAAPTNWAFNQLAQLAAAPPAYLRKLPSDMAADCINFGLQKLRSVEEVGLLSTVTGDELELRAATGPNYGRIWNEEVIGALIQKFGDGVTGQWKVPGEFGKHVEVTKANTTIYGSDRNIFVFLCDEENRIEVSNRRNGQPGSLARGFFTWNSEVGSDVLGIAGFLFDFVCQNRYVWGVQGFTEKRLRHTAGAPDRYLEEITPLLHQYATSAASPIEAQVAAAQASKIDDATDFLTKRFSRGRAEQFKAAFEREEDRPIETMWDVAVAITALAKTIPNQDSRVDLEREAGKVLDLVAV